MELIYLGDICLSNDRCNLRCIRFYLLCYFTYLEPGCRPIALSVTLPQGSLARSQKLKLNVVINCYMDYSSIFRGKACLKANWTRQTINNFSLTSLREKNSSMFQIVIKTASSIIDLLQLNMENHSYYLKKDSKFASTSLLTLDWETLKNYIKK